MYAILLTVVYIVTINVVIKALSNTTILPFVISQLCLFVIVYVITKRKFI